MLRNVAVAPAGPEPLFFWALPARPLWKVPMHRMIVSFATLAWTLTSTSTDAQQVRTNLGTLTCTVADAIAPDKKPDSEQRPLRCSYRPTAGGAEQVYSGTIAKVGQDRLPSGKLVLIWVVNGPEGADSTPGFLAQSYVGSPVESAASRSTVLLAGQKNDSLSLQSSTPTGEPDTAAVTILDLSLSMIPT